MNSNEFEEKWLSAFAKSIDYDQRVKAGIGFDGFLWHAFSYGYVECLEGNKAKEVFNNEDKEDAHEIHFDPKCGVDYESLEPIAASHLNAEQIDSENLCEFYVVGKDFSWCYVVTHEKDLFGPYFCYANSVQIK